MCLIDIVYIYSILYKYVTGSAKRGHMQGCPQKKKVEWCFYKINKTTRWEVVKNSASPKRPFFFFC